MREIRFDDLETLRGLISDDFGPWGPPKRVTQTMIDQFADVTDDHQWIHTDVDRARAESPFKTTIAHGFLILSLLPGLRDGSELRITGMSSVINYGADRLRFIQPVPAGASIYARRRFVDATEKPRGTQLCTETEVRVVDADKPALLYTSLALYMP